jgi:hypothetical protein
MLLQLARRFLAPFPDQLLGERHTVGNLLRHQLLSPPDRGIKRAHAQLTVIDVQNHAITGPQPEFLA